MKLAAKIAVVLVACLAVGLGLLKFNYGGGERYQDLSTDPAIAEGGLEKLVALDFPPGNVAVSADNRIFFAYHPFAKAERFSDATLFELVDGEPRPFPDGETQPRLQGVFGMTVDSRNRLWAIESAGLDFNQSRLLAFDLSTNLVVFE